MPPARTVSLSRAEPDQINQTEKRTRAGGCETSTAERMAERLERSHGGGHGDSVFRRSCVASSVCLTSSWTSLGAGAAGRAGAFEQQQFGFTATWATWSLAAAAFRQRRLVSLATAAAFLGCRDRLGRATGQRQGSGIHDQHHRCQKACEQAVNDRSSHRLSAVAKVGASHPHDCRGAQGLSQVKPGGLSALVP